LEEKQLLERFQNAAPDYLKRMGGRFVSLDAAARTCVMEFDIGRDFCHTIDVVQGGFVTSMLDITMTHAAFATGEDVVNIASLEIKTTYLEPTRAGRLRVEGCVIKSGYKIAFMEGRIYNAEGLLTATGNSVAKVIRQK
jgi:uncharacterized protein (TIGR00369 family)